MHDAQSDAHSTTNYWPAQAVEDITADGFTVRKDGSITDGRFNCGHVNVSAKGGWLVSVPGVTTIWTQPEFTDRNDAAREAIRMCKEAA